MSFFDHLDEMRKRIIWSIVGIIVGCIIAGVFINNIMQLILLKPAAKVGLNLQNLQPFGQPFLYFKVVFVVGLIISFPFALWQLWLFIAPGLYQHERNWASKITFFTSLCFLTGVAFSYFLMIPSMLAFASSFGSSQIINNIDVNQYFSFITIMLLACGLLFEMPMLAFVLSRFGFLTPKFMRKYRRHAIVVNLILGAILTPTTDPVSMMIFAAPLFILYEISIFVSAMAGRKRKKAQSEEK